MIRIKIIFVIFLMLQTALALAQGQSGRVKKPCGLEGSIYQRIVHCSKVEKVQNRLFLLVTRSQGLNEVYIDVKTGLLWSDRLLVDGEPKYRNYPDALKSCMGNLPEFAGLNDLAWRLPTMDEFEEAHENGARLLLPTMDRDFWTSTDCYWVNNMCLNGKTDFAQAYIGYLYKPEYPESSLINAVQKSSVNNVRCVANGI